MGMLDVGIEPMNVLFVYTQDHIVSPRKPLEYAEQMQLGISYISAGLKAHGHATQLLVASRYFRRAGRKLFKRAIIEFKPDLIAYTSVGTQYDFISSLADYARRIAPAAFSLIGGPAPSLNPDEAIDGPFDAICIGEGEYPVLELVESLARGETPDGIANLWIKRNGQVQKNAPRPFMEDLDSLPLPDRQIWLDWIDLPSRPRFAVLLGRGCPFECTYCCNHRIKQLAPGKYVRLRSVSSILDEIDQLTKQWPGLDELYLEVETIGLDRPWLSELCDGLAQFNAGRSEPISFGANLRITPGGDFAEVFRQMKRANFTFINIGIESGSQRIREEVLARRYSNEDVIRAVTQARAEGLSVGMFNLIGVPSETVEDFQMTVELNRRCQPEWLNTSIFYPYAGTRLAELCVSEGLLPKREGLGRVERAGAPLDLPGFSRRKIFRSYVWFNYYVYKGTRPLCKILPRVIEARLLVYPRLISRVRRIARSGAVRAIRNSFKGRVEG